MFDSIIYIVAGDPAGGGLVRRTLDSVPDIL